MTCTDCVQGLKKVTREFCDTCNGRGGWDDGDIVAAPKPEGVVAKAVKAVKKAVSKK